MVGDLKETDLFPPVKGWLEDCGYEVFTEVKSKRVGGRADIVAVSGPAVAVVEMKMTLSLDLIAQAVRWKPFANYIYIAVPKSRNRKMNGYADMFLRREGIALLEVDLRLSRHQVSKRGWPKFNRRIDDHIRQSLVPQHKDLPGGHAGGGYVTTYSLMIGRVKSFLRSSYVEETDGWATIDQILQHCETHYSSPKPGLSQAIRKYEQDWCEMKVESRKLWCRYKQTQIERSN